MTIIIIVRQGQLKWSDYIEVHDTTCEPYLDAKIWLHCMHYCIITRIEGHILNNRTADHACKNVNHASKRSYVCDLQGLMIEWPVDLKCLISADGPSHYC